MKNLVKVLGMALVMVAALALMGAVPAFAQGPNPAPGTGPCHEAGLLDIDQADMHAAIADALGISVAEFEAARAEGTTLYLLAEELGVDIADVRDAMSAVRDAAIDEALAAGTITEAQADWLRSRPGPGGYGYGYGMHNGTGMRGQGMGQGMGRQFRGQQGTGFGFGAGNGFGAGR